MSGNSCQRWDSQFPVEHNFTDPNDFPESTIAEAANYCRNPDKKDGNGPWCFTTDPNMEWEFCGIPTCTKESTRLTEKDVNYIGIRSRTASGRQCQFWNSQAHHPHPYIDPSAFPEPTLLVTYNYCRNPDGKSTGPWCYTMDPTIEWETCGIPLVSDCQLTQMGFEYTGHHRITVSGGTCQYWNTTIPHTHTFTASSFPDETLDDAANYCRNPNNLTGGPWCFTTDSYTRYEFCDVPRCHECKATHLGETYTGYKSFSASGRLCQNWADITPHPHSFTSSDFPDYSITLARNYCRNPDNHPDGPWCFTIDPDVERESCVLHLCRRTGRIETKRSNSYRGYHFWTKTSILCQRWDTQLPHSHPYTDASQFPDSRLQDAANYCRNPNNDPEGPWCYTVDPTVEKQTCNIPMASDCVPTEGAYMGKQSITVSGRVCQRWAVNIPHYNSYYSFPDRNEYDAVNYCRNPNNDPNGPWCYTLDPHVTKETCGIPSCSECRLTYHGYDYRGTVNTTISGRPCQMWDRQVPHEHNLTNPELFPRETLSEASNYCRNPDRKDGVGPWCFTDDPDVEWEPCGIPMCKDCTVDQTGKGYGGQRHVSLKNHQCKQWRYSNMSYSNSDFYDRSWSRISNNCRNPIRRTRQGTGPWCHSAQNDEEVISCGIPLCKDCRDPLSEYQGTLSRASTGKLCQYWRVQQPRSHSFTDSSYYPDASITDAANYCRNPRNYRSEPWCYTRDGQTLCNLPYCFGKDCTWQHKGPDYLGTYAYTVSGRTCMRWGGLGGQYPHTHSFTSDSFPDPSIDEAYNYCRNPDNNKAWPWCYTTDPLVEWEYCPIISCRDCKTPGQQYDGHRAFTQSKRPCQRWDNQSPHTHSYTDTDFPDDTLTDASNFCRAPDGASVPWCYTLDPDVPKEKCSIHLCSDCYTNLRGAEYMGHTSTTISGRKCQQWNTNTPHRHNFHDVKQFPDTSVGDARNYCRNPHWNTTGRVMPWCFTVDSDVEWEYCHIPRCAHDLINCRSSLIGSDFAHDKNITMYRRVCEDWHLHHGVVPERHTFTGNSINGSLYDFAGVLKTYTGVVESGSCYSFISREITNNGDCVPDSPAFHNNGEYCDIPTSYVLPDNLNDLPIQCGKTRSDFDQECCVDEVQTCVNANWTVDCISMKTGVCTQAVQICCDIGCCTPVNEFCIINGTLGCSFENASSVCCEEDTTNCCDVNCTRALKTCYAVKDMTDFALFIDNETLSLHNSLGNRTEDTYVSCTVELVAELGNFPEDLQNAKSYPSKNYCRNPTNDEKGPWCFAQGLVQYCDIPFCPHGQECTHTIDGFNYTGTTATTVSGRTCQRWDVQSPRTHNYTVDSYFPDDSVSEASNYCRNPDRRLGTGPWCYTTDADVQWEPCGIQLCQGGAPTIPHVMYNIEYSANISASSDLSSGADISTSASSDLSSGADISTSGTTFAGGIYTTYPSTTEAVLGVTTLKPIGPTSWIPRRCDFFLYREITRYNQTIWQIARRLISSFEKIIQRHGNYSAIPHYVLNKTLLEPIRANIGEQCPKCLEANGLSVLQMVEHDMSEWNATVLQRVSVDSLNDIRAALNIFINKAWVKAVDAPILTSDIRDFLQTYKNASDTVRFAIDRTELAVRGLTDVIHFTEDLLDHSWKLECQKQLPKLLNEYERYKYTSKQVLDDFKGYLFGLSKDFQRQLDVYRADNATLEDVVQTFNFDSMNSHLIAIEIKLQRLGHKGSLLVKGIHLQINRIYYSIMSYVDTEHIADTSAYWKHFDLKSPSIKLPKLRNIGGIDLPDMDYGMIPDENGTRAWDEKLNILHKLEVDTAKQLSDLTNSLSTARNYFESYIKSNQIDEDFFRDNFLAVELFYQEMKIRTVIERKYYDVYNLLGDVGGLMGSLLGASIMTFAELSDLLIYNVCKKCKRHRTG